MKLRYVFTVTGKVKSSLEQAKDDVDMMSDDGLWEWIEAYDDEVSLKLQKCVDGKWITVKETT